MHLRLWVCEYGLFNFANITEEGNQYLLAMYLVWCSAEYSRPSSFVKWEDSCFARLVGDSGRIKPPDPSKAASALITLPPASPFCTQGNWVSAKSRELFEVTQGECTAWRHTRSAWMRLSTSAPPLRSLQGNQEQTVEESQGSRAKLSLFPVPSQLASTLFNSCEWRS